MVESPSMPGMSRPANLLHHDVVCNLVCTICNALLQLSSFATQSESATCHDIMPPNPFHTLTFPPYHDPFQPIHIISIISTHSFRHFIISFIPIYAHSHSLSRCISRQLWWGHRIPVWYVDNSEENFIVARNEDEARQKAIERGLPADVPLRQEDDVLDTWFSSGLWPFATVGWPQDEGKTGENTDLERFYPGTCLETGYDILFFWVARMVMLGIELTGVSPFQVIYLHGLVRAADGSKMSKTKGNVVDPLDTVAEYGADSLRYSLVTGVTPGQDIPLNMDKIAANKSFANKLWNCCKFVTENALKGADEAELASLGVTGPLSKEEFDTLALPERYIISKCHELVESVTNDIEKYQLGAAGSKVSHYSSNFSSS